MSLVASPNRSLPPSVVVVASMVCAHLACSLRSLDHLKSGVPRDAEMNDAPADQPLPSNTPDLGTPFADGIGAKGEPLPTGSTDGPWGGERDAIGGQGGADGRDLGGGSGGAGGAGARADGGLAGTGGLGGAGGTNRDSSPDAGLDAKGGSAGTFAGGRGGGGAGGSGGGGAGGSGGGAVGGGEGGRDGGAGTGGAVGTGGSGVVMAGLVAYYTCDQTTGPTLTDSSGHNRHASMMTGTGDAGGYTFGTGRLNNALRLVTDSEGYVAIPQGILNGATDMTIATWVYLNASVNWQRVWDFGTGTKTYMFLTARTRTTPNTLRFGITVDGNGAGAEEQMNDTVELPIQTWKHVAVVLGAGGGFLYVDGNLVTSSTEVKLRPADLGSLTKNYIGRSQFSADPYLDGSIDDFRVYNRALTAAEIQKLFNYTGS